MTLKTEDDYQDKIDDLIKEIDRLYDEGTDKGFKLKRGEEMDFEARKQEALDSLEARAKARKQIDAETIAKDALKMLSDCFVQAYKAKETAKKNGKIAIRSIEDAISDIKVLSKKGELAGDFDITRLNNYITEIKDNMGAIERV